MTLQINMLPNASVNGPSGLMTAAGNPWSVPDAFAQEVVNRGLATAVNWNNSNRVNIYGVTDANNNVTGLAGPGGKSIPLNQYQRMKTAMEAAWRVNPYTQTPYGPAPTWAALTVYNQGSIVRGLAGAAGNLYLQVTGNQFTSAAATGPTGTGTALIADGTCGWQYIGPATATGTYPLYSTVTPTTSANVTNGYFSFINWNNIGAMGLQTYATSQSSPLFSYVDGNYTGVVTPVPKNAGTVALPTRPVAGLKNRFRFITNCRRWLAIGGNPWYQNSAPILGIKVNGRYISEAQPILTGTLINPGGLLIDFTQFDNGPKIVEIHYQGALSDLVNLASGIAVGTDEYIFPFNNASDFKIALEGDSITDNTAIASFHWNWRTEQALGNLLGSGNVLNNAIGGTGLISNNSGTATTYIQRLPDITTFQPDLLIIGGAHNDVGSTSAARLAAMSAYLQAVRAAMPNVIIAVVGTNYLQAETSATMIPVENDWVTAIAAFNDPLTFLIPILTASPPLLPATANNGTMWQNVALGGSNSHPTGLYNQHMMHVVANAVRNWVSSRL